MAEDLIHSKQEIIWSYEQFDWQVQKCQEEMELNMRRSTILVICGFPHKKTNHRQPLLFTYISKNYVLRYE
jgi:hypothetical protein